MRVLLLHLPLARRSYLSRFAIAEPLAHLFLAPLLAPRHELRFVDMRFAPDLERALAGFAPEIALVGINPLSLATTEATLARLRAIAPSVRVLLIPEAEYGNSHIAERPLDFAVPGADALAWTYFLAVLRRTVPAVVDAWSEGRALDDIAGLWLRDGTSWRETASIANAPGPIGIPDRALLGKLRGRYSFAGIGRTAYLLYTFGCRFKCRFCPMSKHDGSIVARPLEEVVGELEAMGEPHVYLQDFEPFLAPDLMAQLAEELERRDLRKRWYMLTRADTALEQEELIRRWQRLGLRWLYLGLDGASDARLHEIRKGSTVDVNERAMRRMQALGLGVSVGFVVRSDFTREDFAELRAYVRRLKPPMVAFTVETPLVGTRLFDDEEQRVSSRDWSLYDLSHAVLPTRLPLDEFYRELAQLQFAGGMRSTLALARHFPARDLVRVLLSGPGAVASVRHSARDHESGAAPRAELSTAT